MAIGYAMIAIARLMGNETLEQAIRDGGRSVSVMEDQVAGLRLAEKLIDKIPLIWSSSRNLPVAYIWKVKFNETAKIPAFCNNFPELNHNEFTGFDVVDSTRHVTGNFHVIMLEDPKDHPRVQKRMSLSKQMLEERGIAVDTIKMRGEHFSKLFQLR
jgi:glucose/mannose-6-phosphate isomerase